MQYKYKLTIAVLTMNRAKQLERALDSCLKSTLPQETQFVIVDNNSTDETEMVANNFIANSNYDTKYEKNRTNLGAGKGRNVCYDLAEGEYVYFLDDDAEIAPECKEIFFMKSIQFMDEHVSVATLTTNIVDRVFGDRSGSISRYEKVGDFHTVYRFHEGSVFLRSKYFDHPLYMDIVYGAEGIPVSVKAIDAGYHNIYDPTIYINHYPQCNKWEEKKDYINMMGASNMYVLKKLQYPAVFAPVLYLVYKMRIRRYKIKDKGLIIEFAIKNKEYLKKHTIKKVKCSTVIKCYKEYGSTIF